MSGPASRPAPTIQVVTLEGKRLRVARVRHPSSGVQCLAFSNHDGDRVALIPGKSVREHRQRLWRLAATDGASYTLGPIDLAVLRRLAG